MLDSPFRADFTAEYGDLMFVNAEIADKAFSPDILDEMAQENKLTTEYGKLIASAQIPFEGGVYTLSQLSPFKNDPDDARRLAAWKAEGAWYKERQADLDRIYDELTHGRDAMGRKRGYGNYLPLGYDRMGRLSYGRKDVERFREAVGAYVVPLADNPLVNAPHTQADLADSDWNHPYSRELACFPSEAVKASKLWPAVNRLDDVYGDRNLFCACVPMSDYAEV